MGSEPCSGGKIDTHREELRNTDEAEDSLNISRISLPADNVSFLSSSSSKSSNNVQYDNLFAFGTTNARSLPSNIESLVDTFEENDLTIMNISETWLKNTSVTDCNVADLEEAHKISLILKNRASRGGGVAIAYDMNKISLKKINVKTKFEIVCAQGQARGNRRKIFCMSYYMPPSMKRGEVDEMTEDLEDCVAKAWKLSANPLLSFPETPIRN